MRRFRKLHHVRLDAETLSRIPHSGALALRPSLLDGAVSLAAEPVEDEPAEGKVAVVSVIGPLAQRAAFDLCAFVDGYDFIQARFEKAVASDADSILVDLDSPGGDCAGCFEAVRSMRAMAERAGKPVVVFVNELAASAGYALAATLADEIILPSSGEVGSVGVVCVHIDATAQLAQRGLRATVIRSRAHKYEGSSLEALSPDTQARWQARVDELDAEFAALVTARRPQARAAVDELAGECASGARAVALGLADRVGTYEQALARAAELGAQRRKRMDKEQEYQARIADLEKRVSAAEAERTRLVEATGTTSVAAALGRIEAGNDAVARLEQAESTARELAAAKAEREKADAIAAVLAEGVQAGRVTPGNRERLAAFGAKYGVEDLRAHVAELPVHPAAKSGPTPPTVNAAGLTAEDRAVARQLGLSDADYAATLVAEKGRDQ